MVLYGDTPLKTRAMSQKLISPKSPLNSGNAQTIPCVSAPCHSSLWSQRHCR